MNSRLAVRNRNGSRIGSTYILKTFPSSFLRLLLCQLSHEALNRKFNNTIMERVRQHLCQNSFRSTKVTVNEANTETSCQLDPEPLSGQILREISNLQGNRQFCLSVLMDEAFTCRRSSVRVVLMSVHLVGLAGAARRRSWPVTYPQVVARWTTHAVPAHRSAHAGTLPLLKTSTWRGSHARAQPSMTERRHRRHRAETRNRKKISVLTFVPVSSFILYFVTCRVNVFNMLSFLCCFHPTALSFYFILWNERSGYERCHKSDANKSVHF